MASVWEARAKQAGASLARDLFAERAVRVRTHKRGELRAVVVRLSERELAAVVAAAFQTGAEYAERVLAVRDEEA